jgi:hypothetical protein
MDRLSSHTLTVSTQRAALYGRGADEIPCFAGAAGELCKN